MSCIVYCVLVNKIYDTSSLNRIFVGFNFLNYDSNIGANYEISTPMKSKDFS
jgi:hypothetical protein